jgi:hypothetical protein
VDLTQYLAVGDLGDGDQEIAVVQKFVDRAVPRRMTCRKIERPGSDGAYYALPDIRGGVGQNFGSANDRALKPCFRICTGFGGRFPHRLLQGCPLRLSALVNEAVDEPWGGDVVSDG